MRGPAFDGLDMSVIIHAGYEFVHLCKAVQPNAKVLLTGYSRGGAGVIGVAARLGKDNVSVIVADVVPRAQPGPTWLPAL